jgi:hypothetical protein
MRVTLGLALYGRERRDQSAISPLFALKMVFWGNLRVHFHKYFLFDDLA